MNILSKAKEITSKLFGKNVVEKSLETPVTTKIKKRGKNKSARKKIPSEPIVKIYKDYPVEAFTKIRMDGWASLVFTQGEDLKVTVIHDEQINPSISVTVDGDSLCVIANGSYPESDKFEIQISAPFVTAIYRKGFGHTEIKNIWQENFTIEKDCDGNLKFNGICSYLDLNVKSSGVITLNGDIEKVKITKKVVSKVKFYGTVKNAIFDICSAGNTDSCGLIAQNVILYKDGPGSVKVYASESIVGTVKCFGAVSVYGAPSIRDIHKPFDTGDIQYHGIKETGQ